MLCKQGQNPGHSHDNFFIGGLKRDCTFLILLPIHRPPNLLKFAIASILNQTEQNYQLHIIGDGAPEETTHELLSLAKHDNRITSHIFAKGERNGEVYRDLIIRESRAKIICQIADDDIWFPHHLREIGCLLQDFDFGNTIQTEVAPNHCVHLQLGDISDKRTVSRMLNERFNVFGPTASGYRKEAYLKLDDGWTAAPLDIMSNLHMWRKFLRHDEIKCGTRFSFTNIHIGDLYYKKMTIEEREEANQDWLEVVSDVVAMNKLELSLFEHACLSQKRRYRFKLILNLLKCICFSKKNENWFKRMLGLSKYVFLPRRKGDWFRLK